MRKITVAELPSEINSSSKRRLKNVVLSLFAVLSFISCKNEIDTKHVADKFVEEFSEYENLHEDNVEHALLTISEIINAIESNTDLRDLV